MKRAFLLLLTLLLFFSCSGRSLRAPAGTENPFVSSYTSDEVLLVLKSRAGDMVPEESYHTLKHLQKRALSNFHSVNKGISGNDNLSVRLVSKELAENVSISFDVEINEKGKFIFKILHSPDAKLDKAAIYKAQLFVDEFISKDVLQTYYDSFEWFYNAKKGDPVALQNISKLWLKVAEAYPMDEVSRAGLQEHRKIISEVLDREVKLLKKERKRLEKMRKEKLALLDKAAAENQLRSLVAAGKRVEAADLIDNYLPKEQMAPFELKFWSETLENMRNPVPMSERVLVFRGIDDDVIYPAIVNGIELDKEKASSESKAFSMSSVMTKNQGTWNRRLRSLQTMMNKFIGSHHITGSSEFTQSFRISTFFKQHSRNPQGSPFLSHTPIVNVSTEFGNRKAVAYLIDQRTVMANYTSIYKNEFEFLTTLVTFPDEMVVLYDRDLHGFIQGKNREEFFLKGLKSKMIKEYGETEGIVHYKKIKKTFDFHNRSSNFDELEVADIKAKSFFEKIKEFFFKKNKKEKVVTEAVVVTKHDKGCTYIIKEIFKLN